MNIVFVNASPNYDGCTYQIGERLLKGIQHDVLQMSDYKISQYGKVYEDDQMVDLLKQLKEYDTLVIGSPVYWYTVSGILKTFIDRLYLLPEAEYLKGKKLYLFAQGSAPDEDTKKSIRFLSERVSTLMGMDLKGVVIDRSDGENILQEMVIENV